MKRLLKVGLWVVLFPVMLPIWLWKKGRVGKGLAGGWVVLLLLGAAVAGAAKVEPVAEPVTMAAGDAAAVVRPTWTATTVALVSTPTPTVIVGAAGPVVVEAVAVSTPVPTPTAAPIVLSASTEGVASGAAVWPAGVPGDAEAAQLVDVVDGDTIKVLVGGREESVRYVGIDTPERGQAGYRAATEANRVLLGSGALFLVRDRTDRDRYDRLLRYVYNADGVFVDGEMVRQGWAQPVEYAPDTAHAAEFRQYAVEAAQAGVGFWSGSSAFDGAMAYGLTTGTVNVREGPGTDFEVSGSVAAGTPVTIFGRNEAGDWVQVRMPDRSGGWMYVPLLAVAVPVAGIGVASGIPVAEVQSQATAAPAASVAVSQGSGSVRIVAVDKREEFVTVRNEGADAVNLRGWTLVSEKGDQRWTVPMDFELLAGATVLIHALDGQNDQGNLYSGFGGNIWNNSEPDAAVLLDGGGVEVSRYP